MKRCLLSIACLFPCILYAHGNHPHHWLHALGKWHLLFIHYPIALFSMSWLSECIMKIFKKEIFKKASRFMLISSAVLSIPTVILGFALSAHTDYPASLLSFFDWHRGLGVSIMLLSLIAVYLNLRLNHSPIYFILITFLFLATFVTAFLGGRLALHSIF